MILRKSIFPWVKPNWDSWLFLVNSSDRAVCCLGLRLVDDCLCPVNYRSTHKQSRSEVSFDAAGCRSEIAMRATFGVRTHAC